MTRLLPLALLAFACSLPPKDAAPAPAAPADLPAGFAVRGAPEVEEPYLDPPSAYREMLSRLTTLRADCRARSEEVLVTFETHAYHVTSRSGRRLTTHLPEGLTLAPRSPHLLLGSDLTIAAYDAQGRETPPAEETPVLEARIAGGTGGVEEFRLVTQGGTGIRSIPRSG